MTGISTAQIQEITRVAAQLGAHSNDPDKLLEIAYPQIRGTALAGQLAGGNRLDVLKDWIKSTFRAACFEAGQLGVDIWETLQNPQSREETTYLAVLVSFLYNEMGFNAAPIPALTALAMLIVSLNTTEKT